MLKKVLKAIFNPSETGKIRMFFVFILILVISAGLMNFGNYINQGIDYLNNKTGNKITLPHIKEKKFMLGLDLQGGTHLVYQADMSLIENSDRANSLAGVRDVIEKRVNAFGISESVVQTNISGDNYQLIVELAGVRDSSEAIKMIGETPILEFKEVGAESRELTDEEVMEMATYNTKAKQKAQEALDKVLVGEDFATIAKEYSEDKNSSDSGGDLGLITRENNEPLFEVVKDLEVGKTNTELIQALNGFEIILLEDKKTITNSFDESKKEKEVEASHILICYKDSEGCSTELTKEEALAKIKEIKEEATQKNFADLAKKYSNDTSNASTGGELGWFDRDVMVTPFTDTVFDNQKVGEISYVVETKFGYHLILKTNEREKQEYKVKHIFVATKSKEDYLNQQQWKNTELTGKYLKKAIVSINQTDGTPQVSLNFDEEGSKLFEQITERNVGKQVAIFLDGYIISAPTVNSKITGGQAVISGKFNIEEAKLLSVRLNAGALPVPIELVNQQVIGASLGQKSLETSFKAGLIGLAFIALFMIIYYRFLGFLSVLSLIIYGILVLTFFKLFNIALSLSGIAGFILSIGMAVDANVLIFERLKEELKDQVPLNIAIENSFLRAWPSIRDGNLSTLITCFVLMQISTGLVKGFAITLALGIIISMFSAIIVTKNFIQMFVGDFLEKHLCFLIGLNKSKK